MATTIRRIARVVLCVGVVAAAWTPPAKRALFTDVPTSAAREMTMTLRKLHLVRPDLILYPMTYEVLC